MGGVGIGEVPGTESPAVVFGWRKLRVDGVALRSLAHPSSPWLGSDRVQLLSDACCAHPGRPSRMILDYPPGGAA